MCSSCHQPPKKECCKCHQCSCHQPPKKECCKKRCCEYKHKCCCKPMPIMYENPPFDDKGVSGSFSSGPYLTLTYGIIY